MFSNPFRLNHIVFIAIGLFLIIDIIFLSIFNHPHFIYYQLYFKMIGMFSIYLFIIIIFLFIFQLLF